jgi:hypothetical protein
MDYMMHRTMENEAERFLLMMAPETLNQSELERNIKELLIYYASNLASSFTSFTLIERGPRFCTAESVVYSITQRKLLANCDKVAQDQLAKWLQTLKMNAGDVNSVWWNFNEAIYFALVAHEMGHVATNEIESTGAAKAELEADAFAMRIFTLRQSDFFMARQVWWYLNFFWGYMSKLDLKTQYDLPSHEEARVVAFSKANFCGPGATALPPDGATSTVDAYRSLMLSILPQDLCPKPSK